MTKQFKVLYRTAIILLAGAAAMLLGAFILWAIGADVTKTYSVITRTPEKPDTDRRSDHPAIPLTVIALGSRSPTGAALSNRRGGQMAMGILAATAVALALPGLPKAVLLRPWPSPREPSAGRHGHQPGLLKAKLQSASCSPR